MSRIKELVMATSIRKSFRPAYRAVSGPKTQRLGRDTVNAIEFNQVA
jgi:hypothetical protein